MNTQINTIIIYLTKIREVLEDVGIEEEWIVKTLLKAFHKLCVDLDIKDSNDYVQLVEYITQHTSLDIW